MQAPSIPRLVLVLQSDPAYVQLITDVLAGDGTRSQVVAIADSQAALTYLRRQPPYETAQRPDLILLDLDLPGGPDSHTLLTTIKGDAALRRIPIIVLTLSEQAEDVFAAYALQGNCYIVRSDDRDRLTRTIRRIETFWLTIVTLPVE